MKSDPRSELVPTHVLAIETNGERTDRNRYSAAVSQLGVALHNSCAKQWPLLRLPSSQNCRNQLSTDFGLDSRRYGELSKHSVYQTHNNAIRLPVLMTSQPIPPNRLKQICNDACDSALATASAYDHAATKSWNDSIINSILKALISESSTSESAKYKFAVNSTIIQHLSDPRPEGTEAGTQTEGEGTDVAEEGVSMGTDDVKKVGRRGMHSASGAYWNNERDGMWSHKYEGGEGKGMDIVISVMWIAV